MADDKELEYRVKLRNSTAGAGTNEVVTFFVTPDLSESRSVNYKTVDPIHSPGQIYAFVNTASRTFQLSAVKLVSRTREEAKDNLEKLWLLKAWTMPAFGRDPLAPEQRAYRIVLDQAARSDPSGKRAQNVRSELQKRTGFADDQLFGTDLRGQPPAVLEFSAYAHDGHLGTAIGHINRVPVVITSLNISYPSDVDYFPTTNGVPMPTIMSIDISLSETHSPQEYEKFSLNLYKRGILPGF